MEDMAKQPEKLFSCSKCDSQFPKWAGQCATCGAWGTIRESSLAPEETLRPTSRSKAKSAEVTSFAALTQQSKDSHQPTGLSYWDSLLSGGFVGGAVTLLGGEPGVGKSTVLAQLGLMMAAQGKHVLYVTGEESPAQVALRLKRLAKDIPATFSFLDSTNADVIAATIREQSPALTIVDSVQTIRVPEVIGEPGNPTQIKAGSAIISEAAKQSRSAVVLVGQVTKDGELAGPRLLEHLVDTVLMMEGDRYQSLRVIRILKHRFGSTEEVAMLAMTERGLEEVKDPSALLLSNRPLHAPGSVLTCLMEGTRPILIEIQALVTPAAFGSPSRRATGVDTNRLSLILAVLGRRAAIGFGDQDVFVNVVGGMSATDPSIDFAIALALVSAKLDKPVSTEALAIGEIGLTGELRPVQNTSGRIKEAHRLGLTTIYLAQSQKLPKLTTPLLKPYATLRDAVKDIFPA
jgi:DNA repair protein RadA/Sms